MPKPKITRRDAARKQTAKRVAPAKGTTASRQGPPKKAAKLGKRSTDVTAVTSEDEAAFTEALIQSGQAACLDSDGKLPAGATHKIVEDEAGQKKVVRRRFSMT